jgi:hypothetical protein
MKLSFILLFVSFSMGCAHQGVVPAEAVRAPSEKLWAENDAVGTIDCLVIAENGRRSKIQRTQCAL